MFVLIIFIFLRTYILLGLIVFKLVCSQFSLTLYLDQFLKLLFMSLNCDVTSFFVISFFFHFFFIFLVHVFILSLQSL